MATYVLVGGAWIGAWAWKSVAADLRARGHVVYPLSLTGLGERAHLARPEVDLETHITDVTNTLEFEDLSDVVLVGHSYAGSVITGAADRAGPAWTRSCIWIRVHSLTAKLSSISIRRPLAS